MAVISLVWPGILGAAATGMVIYLSLRRVAGSRTHPAGLQWPADVDASTGQEAGATDQRLG